MPAPGRRGRTRPALPAGAGRAAARSSAIGSTSIEADALDVDERARLATAPMSSPTCPTMSAPRCWSNGSAAIWPPWWRSLTLMFQKEVAERIVAAPGSDAYGRLSVAAQWRSRAADRDDGQPLGIRPAAQGDVGGGPYRAQRTARRASIRAVLERLTEAAFGQRRKMLRSSLKAVPGALEARWRDSASTRNDAPKRSTSTNGSRLARALGS